MSRLAKLRRSPELFLADSRSRALRALAPRLPRLVSALLEDPVAALARSRVPLVAPAVAAGESLAARRRWARLRRAGLPTITVVMAARDAAATIDAALASVIAQRYQRFDVIVIDDASLDDTAARVEAIAAREPRIRLVRNPGPHGAARARNLGLHLAAGDYVTFHDADDRSHPERFERQLDELLRRPGVVACVCNFRRELPDGTPIAVNRRPVAKCLISLTFPRRRVLDRIGYLADLPVSEDAEYYHRVRATFGDDAVAYLFKTLYFARFAPGSLLFGAGETTVDPAQGVTFVRSPAIEAELARIEERMRRIRAGELDPYVPFTGPDGAPAPG